ncbi:MAG: peptidoglycan DD-metalloendopeptidase family protein [Methanomassiliicoccales archaeon]
MLIAFPTQAPTVSASVPFAPIKVRMEYETVIAYEIEFSDFDLDQMTLTGAKVFCIDNGTLLQDIGGSYLAATYHSRSLPAPTADELWHGTGKLLHSRLSVFLTVANASGLTALGHQFSFTWRGGQVLVEGPQTFLQNRTVPSIGPPLSGANWIGVETSIATSHHMRDQITLDNITRCPQRYAVDYMMMFDDMTYYRNDGKNNSDWYCYGADLLAVADGVVTYAIDGIEDNTPFGINSSLPLLQAGGNYVIIDIGDGNFAQYGHMIPGSVNVTVGQHVTKGQVIGLQGNSGNSYGPHLHFQLGTDPYSILASEGLPFQLDHYHTDGLLLLDSTGWPQELVRYSPPQQWSDSWMTINEWMNYGTA